MIIKLLNWIFTKNSQKKNNTIFFSSYEWIILFAKFNVNSKNNVKLEFYVYILGVINWY